MEHPGLSFLMNLNGNNVASVHGEAPELLKGASDPNDVNAFFTMHAGLATDDAPDAEGSIQALMNSAGGGFFGHIDLAGTGFGADALEEFSFRAEFDGAGDIPGAETLLANHYFNHRLRGSVSDGGIEQIERLDTPNRSEQVKGRMRSDFSIGLRAVRNDAPAIANHAEIRQVQGDNPELPAISEKQNQIRAIKYRASADIFTINQQIFASVPAAPSDELNYAKATNGLALQFEQSPARNIKPKSGLSIEAKPAHNQKLPLNKTQPFDFAALAATGPVRTRHVPELSFETSFDDKARESNLSVRNPNSVIEAAPSASTAVLTQSNETKRQIAPVNNELLLDVESADLASDEPRFFEPRFASRSEVGGMAPTISNAAPVTMSAIAAAPAVAERLAGDERHSTSAIEAAGFMQTHQSGERAPVQFAPPTMLPPAGAAWAQVISAISERNGETKLELRLNPPELGRVVIAFESDGAEIVRAVVSADSQQTLDLMRRNIDILQRELARSGLDNINVELADRDSHSQSHDDANEQTVAYAAIDDTPAQLNNNIPLAPLIADGRLDLRV